MSGVLTAEEIRACLPGTEMVGRKILCYETVDSTNALLKAMACAGTADGTVVLAERQTAGRGRLGREFLSPAGQGIWLSALLRPELPPEQLQLSTALCAVAVCDAVEQVCGVRPGIKWTNDLVLGQRKLGGILTELQTLESGPALIFGIGLNICQQEMDFPPELRKVATSLELTLGTKVERAALAAAEIAALDALYADLRRGETERYLLRYRRDCITLGKTVQILRQDGSRETVFAETVDEAFGLVIRRDDGTGETVRSGEVSVRGMYGYLE